MEPTPLKRSLSLALVTFYGIGTILGAGIYVLVGKVAGYAGMAAPMAFLVASLLAAFSAFSYAELSSRFPKSAGEAVYVQKGLGLQQLALLTGLLIVLIGVVSAGTMAHGFVGYLKTFIDWPDVPVLVGLILLIGSVAAWGIAESVLIVSLITVFEVLGLVIIIWVGRGSYSLLPESLPAIMPVLELPAIVGILLGGFIAFYAFIGFEDMVNVAEEVKQPQRNLPRAIVLALLVTTFLYLTVSLTCVLSVAPDELAQSDAPLAMVYTRHTGQSAEVISLISLLSILNGAMVQIIMASRVLYGLSRQGWIPAVFGWVHPWTRTPLVATGLVIVAILTFALILPLLSLAKFTSFVTLTVFTLINLALWRIKRRGVERAAFQIPYWVPVTGFFFNGFFLLFQIYHLVAG